VYFPQSVPGIGAGSILVFILAIGYYITPEIVGGTSGIFISNRIAYHISSSLNWGLGAALGAILLAAVMMLYYAYDMWHFAWKRGWKSETVWAVPLWIPYLVMPVGFGLFLLQLAADLWMVLRGEDIGAAEDRGY
jgi:ABC-type spermidine/putrescine transport system permease subunit II